MFCNFYCHHREPNEHDAQSILYEKPYTRIASYLVGMVLGYVLHSVKSWNTSKVFQLLSDESNLQCIQKQNVFHFDSIEQIGCVFPLHVTLLDSAGRLEEPTIALIAVIDEFDA